MDFRQALARRIFEAFEQRKHRARLGRESYSQAALAEGVARRLGLPEIHQTTVSKWMRPKNSSPPDVETLYAIAGELGVPPGPLAFGEEAMSVPAEFVPDRRKAAAKSGRGQTQQKPA